MSLVSQIVDLFKSKSNEPSENKDSLGIITPLTEVVDYLEKTKVYLNLFLSNTKLNQILKEKSTKSNPFIEKGKEAYLIYLKALSPHDLAMERQVPLSTAQTAIDAILGNLDLIEDNFQKFFGGLNDDPTSMKTSSLVVIGYIETASAFGNWVTQLTNHLAPKDDDGITPFTSKELIKNASVAAQFVSNNLGPWTPRYKGFLNLITDLQKKGVDVAIKSNDTWMDSFIHDRQFSIAETNLITAGFSNPILSWATNRMVKQQHQIELLQRRKEWLISKIAMEEAKSRNLDSESPEYLKLKKAIDYYSSMVSKQEQKIERLR